MLSHLLSYCTAAWNISIATKGRSKGRNSQFLWRRSCSAAFDQSCFSKVNWNVLKVATIPTSPYSNYIFKAWWNNTMHCKYRWCFVSTLRDFENALSSRYKEASLVWFLGKQAFKVNWWCLCLCCVHSVSVCSLYFLVFFWCGFL